MSTVLEEHIRAGYVVVYVDDICIFTKTDDPLEHLDKLEKVLDSLRQHDLLAKGIKCSLFRTEMEFLGFLVSADGTRPTPSKVEAVVRMAPPETISQLRSFLGMMNFFASHSTVPVEPFSNWAMDLIGPVPLQRFDFDMGG
jgi:hypothetical protein